MTISEDANAAADYIEEHGWCRNTLRDESGQVCLIGAVYGGTNMLIAAGHLPSVEKAVRADSLINAVENHLGISGVPNWNDHPMRTKEEVIQALRDVAIKHAPDEMRSNGEGQ